MHSWTKFTSKGKHEHTCKEPPSDLVNRLLCWYLTQMIPTMGRNRITDVVVEARKSLPDSNLREVDSKEVLIKYLSQEYLKAHPVAKSAKTVATLVLTEDQKTLPGDIKFLQHDDGPEDPERILFFACPENLVALSRCDVWLADGTFAICPKMFYQLWVVHGVYENAVIPFAFFLLPGKSEAVYTWAFTLLKTATQQETKNTSWNGPQKIVLDYELA